MSISVTPIPRLIDLAAPSFTLGTANAAGSAVTAVASDATLLVFDSTAPTSVAASSVVGTATTAPHRDHVHAGIVSPLGANLDLATYLLVGNGGSTGIAVSDDGEVNMAAQPAFLAYNSATESDVTGAGANYSLGFDLEKFDIGSNFGEIGGVGTFTAPITGKYFLSGRFDILGLTTDAAAVIPTMQTSNNNFGAESDGLSIDGEYSTALVLVADMDANDTAIMKLQVTGIASNVVDIRGTGIDTTTFSGFLAT